MTITAWTGKEFPKPGLKPENKEIDLEISFHIIFRFLYSNTQQYQVQRQNDKLKKNCHSIMDQGLK